MRRVGISRADAVETEVRDPVDGRSKGPSDALLEPLATASGKAKGDRRNTSARLP